MCVTKSVVVGLVSLVSLVSTVNAAKATGKPALARRQAMVTVTSDGCTAICVDYGSEMLGVQCDVYCEQDWSTMPATSTSPSPSTLTTTKSTTVTSKPKAALNQRTVVSSTDSGCHSYCSMNLEQGDFDCDFTCDESFSTSLEPTPTVKAPLHQRTVATAADGDCTATCWDLMPGTECDVKCSSDTKTENADVGKAARMANRKARENVQAQQVHDARLARKFGGLAARDDDKTVTVTSIPEECTGGPGSSISTTIAGIPTILPMQVPQAAAAPTESALLSQASAALSAAQQGMSSFASADSSDFEVASSLSSASTAASPPAYPTGAAPVPTSSTTTIKATTTATSTVSETTTTSTSSPEVTTASATVSKTITTSTSSPEATTASATVSETITTSTTSSETTTASTTTTGAPIVSAAATTFALPRSGATHKYTVSAGSLLCLLVGLASNVVSLI